MSAHLEALQHELRGFKGLFLSPDDLEWLDVQAVPVSLGSGNELNFDPCYFRPHPDGLFKKYPIIQDDDDDVIYMEPYPTLQEVIDRDPSNPINPILAKMESGYRLECFPEWNDLGTFDGDFKLSCDLSPNNHISELSSVMDRHLWAARRGSDGEEVMLGDMLPNFPEADPVLHWVGRKIESMMQYIDRPYSAMQCLSCVYMAEENRGLTRGELACIVTMLLMRLKKKPFRDCEIHPILICSLFGGPMARIIQATYDGKDLLLQYSPLWRIRTADAAPKEIIVRYQTSEAVDGIRTLPLK
ncbi:hypothetical protein N7535_006802 [Penicillium sp. DV-2018c]|nr:hypothetical protein N7461_007114 [Penicillium sp. DV-2018c]KAJ5567496.1 hypothetical protein N7535_006802 [Penicillium sp. DV-2018c]